MSDITGVLRDKNFRFNKQFGQNFITDTNLLDAIVADSGITPTDTVVEIGTGAGTLTRAIAGVARRVISFEIDKNLSDVLAETLQDVSNAEVIFRDIMKVSDEELRQLVGGDYKVVANLPYYITTPIIMRFLEGDFLPQSLTIMVQKEVAERLTAQAGSAEYGAITAVVQLYAKARITRVVGKQNFYPVPKVDSSVIRLDIDTAAYPCDKAKVKQVIKAAFAMRRKTLVNNLMTLGANRQQIEAVLQQMGLDVRVRGEQLGLSDFIVLAEKLL